MTKIARRAPGSADMRAALAALYWARGDARRAEDEWEYACDKISVSNGTGTGGGIQPCSHTAAQQCSTC